MVFLEEAQAMIFNNALEPAANAAYDFDLQPRDSNQMPRLTLGQRASGLSQRDNFFIRQKCFQEAGFVVASGAAVIAPKGFGHGFRVEMKLGSEKFKEQFHQPH